MPSEFKGYKIANTNDIVYKYDPAEYTEHRIVNPNPGEPDRGLQPKWFRCDVCQGKFPIEDYMDAWDWGGPQCPNPECGNGGMTLFAKQEGPVISGKGAFVDMIEKQTKLLKEAIKKLRK